MTCKGEEEKRSEEEKNGKGIERRGREG